MKDMSPWFKWFPARWNGSMTVRAMTAEQKGCYIDLLSLSWIDDGIRETELEKISRYIKVDLKCTLSVLELSFKLHDGIWRNDLQEELREIKNKGLEGNSRGGKTTQAKRKSTSSGVEDHSKYKEVDKEVDKNRTDKKKEKHYSVDFDRTTGKFTNISESLMERWTKQFPGVNILSKLSDLELWLMGEKPGRIKNYTSFITNCLKKEKPVNQWNDDPDDEITRDETGKIIKKYGLPYHG